MRVAKNVVCVSNIFFEEKREDFFVFQTLFIEIQFQLNLGGKKKYWCTLIFSINQIFVVNKVTFQKSAFWMLRKYSKSWWWCGGG